MPFYNTFSTQPGIFFLILALFFTGMLCIFMAVVAWKYRHVHAAVTFSALMLAASIYSLGYFFELNSSSLPQVFFWLRIQYLGIVALPPLWLLFILQYTDRPRWLKRPFIAGLFVIPFLSLMLVLTNNLHSLHYRSLTLVPVHNIYVVSIEPGPLYWMNIVYFVIMFIVATFFLLEDFMHSSSYFKRRFMLLFIGSLFPWAAFLIYILNLSPIKFDTIPFSLFFAGIIFLGDLIYFKPFDILPIARANVFHAIGAGVMVLDSQERIVDMNEAAQELFGVDKSLIGNSVSMVLDAFTGPRQVSDEEMDILECAFDSPGGRLWLDIRSSKIKGHSNNTKGRLLIIGNITERKEAETALRESESLKSSIVEAIPDVLVRFNGEGYCLDILGSSEDASLTRKKMLGKTVHEALPKILAKRFMSAIEAALQTLEIQSLEYSLVNSGGGLYFEARIKAYAENEVVAIIRDITPTKRYQEKLEYLSLHDQLTGLYNRAFFEAEMQRFSQSREYPITIISADLDGLKHTNDTMGHDQGDKMLKAVATVIKKSLRRGDIFARVGGDEFAIILPRTEAKTGEGVIERITDSLQDYNKKNRRLPLSFSLGMATAENEAVPLTETFKEADNIMYQDKLNHKRERPSTEC